MGTVASRRVFWDAAVGIQQSGEHILYGRGGRYLVPDPPGGSAEAGSTGQHSFDRFADLWDLIRRDGSSLAAAG